MVIKRKNASASGFTLMEAMMAIVIIGILAVSGAAFFGYAAQFRARARAEHAATIEANSMMEWAYQAARRSHYDAAPGYFNPDPDSKTITFSSGGNPGAEWTFDGIDYPVSIYFEPDADDVALITVTVGYTGGRTVTLTAYRYCEED
jgi:prepilin-type N-terminal cleavage/methylation domain-containing protein